MTEGLTEQEAKKIIKRDGYNDLELQEKKYFWQTIFELIKEPMIILLIIGFILYLILGDKAEAIFLLMSILGIITLTVYQDRRTEKSLDALKKIASPYATVIRDGVVKRINSREIVMEDIILIEEGDRIPADGKIIQNHSIEINESLLTGESRAVIKNNSDSVFAGTMVTKGRAKIKVTQTGLKTRMGDIGKSLSLISDERTALQRELTKIIVITALIAISFCILLFIIYGLKFHNWLEGLLASIVLAMGALPEEFPIVLTIYITIGAWKLAQEKILAKHAIAIETLGKTTVFCVDKTGTLTQNKMEVSSIFYYDKKTKEKEIIEYGLLASREQSIDPIEIALYERYKNITNNSSFEHKNALEKEYFIKENMSNYVKIWKGNKIIIAAKGSPESIMDLCHLNKREQDCIYEEIKKMAKDGLRILAIAKEINTFTNQKYPENRHDIDYQFLGLIGFSDPLRPETKDAIKLCYDAGVRTILITGDYIETAKSIATKIGLKNNNEVIEGKEINILTENELREKLRYVNVFARVSPDQKLKIIELLKKNDEVVAMTGDGINDAPALKAADIGIAMGYRGTDVAKEASDIVLLNDNFSSVVNGIAVGRNIFNNLKKAMSYIVSLHVPLIGLSLLPIILNYPLILFPAHIVFLEFIIDPACAFVFQEQNNQKKLMKNNPEKLNTPLFNKNSIAVSMIYGCIVLIVAFIVFTVELKIGKTAEFARSSTFLSLIFGYLTLILVYISYPESILKKITNIKGKSFLGVIICTAILVLIVYYVPVIRNIFQVDKLHLTQIITSFSMIIAIIISYEFGRLIKISK